MQTLAKIRVNNIVSLDTHIKINITDLVKTSAPHRDQPCLEIPFFSEKPEICVATTLLDYIETTNKLRHNNEDYLFLTYRKPHKPATVQTLSRWVKEVLHSCGVDRNFTSHSTRHSSTSAARRLGLNVEKIRKTAGWTESSNMFARFYNRPLANDNNTLFAKTILQCV